MQERSGYIAVDVSAARPNAKALHELILYYLRERTAGNLGLTRLIACNIYEWYIFDAADFDRYFYSDKGLVRQFRDWEGNRFSSARTDAEIDSLVCDLYGLTAEEIRILEESGRTTDL